MNRKMDFTAVREIALELPDVADGTTSRGFALKLRGKLLACEAIHKSAEPGSLMVRVSFEDRAQLLTTEPAIYYVTDHYSNRPAILVRPSAVNRHSLRGLLDRACQFVSSKEKK